MMQKKKIFLISSSTGGHAIPVLELYNELKKVNEFDIKIIHSGSEVEKKIFPRENSIILCSGKVNRFKDIGSAKEYLKVFAALFLSIYLLLIHRPKLIFSKGGFSAVPILFWARIFKIPYLLHESDSVMGLSNKMFYKNSLKAFVSFPKDVYNLKDKNVVYSGMIIRDIVQQKSIFDKPVLLFAGGSQGSEVLNNIVMEILPELLKDYKVIHHIGTYNIENIHNYMKNIPEILQKNYSYFEFSYDKMIEALVNADLVVSRAGSTIGEIAKLKKASILIPYPYAASDHQMKNAKYLEKVGGAILIKQNMLNERSLLERIRFVIGNEKNMEIIGQNANKAIKTDGKFYIVQEIKKYFGV